MQKIKIFDKRFSESFKSIHKFFLRCSVLKSEKNFNLKDVIPKLNLDVVDFILSIPILQNTFKDFNILKYLDYHKNIYGLNIPYSYGQVAIN